MATVKPISQPIYIRNTDYKISNLVIDIFSVIIFPIGLCRLGYRFAHSLVGRIIVPASNYPSSKVRNIRKDITFDDKWKVKRISVKVDGYTIDAAIVGQAKTLENGRWVLSSNGNGELYEQKFDDYSFGKILSELNANTIVFNYPGVGASTGMPSREAMAKAYRVMLHFLEDSENGIGAKEIIGYGHSIGGGVQGDALNDHELKEDIKYVFVKRQTFSTLSSIASKLASKILPKKVSKFLPNKVSEALVGTLVSALGWNMGSVNSSKKLKAPEIILQTANVCCYTDISNNPELIEGDGIIPAEASLAKELLKDETSFSGNKYFLGIPEGHNSSLQNTKFLTNQIKEMLK